MDATQEQSFIVIGSRAGLKESDVTKCLQVWNAGSKYWSITSYLGNI